MKEKVAGPKMQMMRRVFLIMVSASFADNNSSEAKYPIGKTKQMR
jgi:hypothetical protein